jgi:dipeptidyl aminopeptidase/acylaminoacyl peptidase
VKRRLEQVEIAAEHEAAERAWRVVRSAFAEYEPRPPARRPVAFVAGVAAAAVAALVVVAVSPAGPALVRSVRDAVGTEHAQEALIGLPAAGRLLVDSGPGPWIVNADGSKRLLGGYATSSWSPHGLFEVVAHGHELAALDPKGNVRWSIERPGTIRDPRWSPDGYRVAYRAGRSLRVIAGDGTGDRLLARRIAAVPPAWQPSRTHALTYVTESGAIVIVDADSGATIARRHGTTRPLQLAWSRDGKQLLSVGSDTLEVRTADLARAQSLHLGAGTIVAATWAPAGGRFAVVAYDGGHDRSSVVIRGPGRARTVFQGTGRVDGVTWSPDGHWLVLAWRTADQWVLARTSGRPRLRAIASISEQFHSRTFPRVVGWCC